MKKIAITIGIGISVLLLIAQICSAQIPQLIRYQGKLNDSQGIPLEGPYNLTFRIYDMETGGEPLWTEAQTDVPISEGFFNVLLGQITVLNLPFDKDYWLSIHVNDDDEMVPRQRITSVSYAFRAKVADTVGSISASQVAPQGAGSGLDADFVDGYQASDLLNLSLHTGSIDLPAIPQGTGSGLDADLLDSQHGSFYLSRTNHTGTQIPSTISPQGSGSTLDADTVDGIHATTSASAGKLLALDGSAKLPASITGDADTVDGFHAASTPQANKLFTLDGSARLPAVDGSQLTNVVKMKTGVYVGTAGATQSITGVGFKPKYIEIRSRNNVGNAGNLYMKTEQMSSYARYSDSNVIQYILDLIISFDSDGFTVGDGTGSAGENPNVQGGIYDYIVTIY